MTYWSPCEHAACEHMQRLAKEFMPLKFWTFCHVITTNVNVFYCNWVCQANTKWHIIVKWKENDLWFSRFQINILKMWRAYSLPVSILSRSTFRCNYSCKRVKFCTLCKIAQAQAQSGWIERVCEQQFPSLVTDPHFGLGQDFDWTILKS